MNEHNLENARLKSCILMTLEEYQELILSITYGLKIVEYCYDGLCYIDTELAEETEIYHNEYIEETLSDYFNVKVTSVHADDCENPIGIWIVYE